MYIVKINIVIEGDGSDLKTQDEIERCFQQSMREITHSPQLVSTEIKELDGNLNYGKCIKCGTWTSDSQRKGYVNEFSDGIQIEGNWFCDLCLPNNHPRHF